LAKNADRIESTFRNDFLPDFLHELAVLETIDFDRLSTSDLLLQLKKRHEDFIHKTHIEVDTINIAATFYLERAKAMLAKAGHDPACHLAHIPETTYGRAILDATKLSGHARQSFLSRTVGHRAVLDYELAEPRYAEDPVSLDILCRSHDSWSASTSSLQSEIPVAELTDEELQSAVVVARNFQALKEDAKHHSLRELAVLRRIVLALDKRLELGGLIFYLTFDECLALADCSLDEARALASQRHTQAAALKNAPSLPPTLTICNLETLSDKPESDPSASGGKISGTRVSGSGVVCGRARVITAADAESGHPIANLGEGEIIVSSMVHPAWVPQFRQIGGFICEIGGWLSHTAIVAREYNLPMIVGTQGLRQIPDGCLLRLNPNGIVDILDEAEEFIEVAA
jgi:phosphohistidine swiveling domain-containing protein